MENLSKCWERAELLLEAVRQTPNKICNVSLYPSSSHPNKWKSIHQKLSELYVEECSREPRQKHLRNASHLLDKLVARDKLGCLLINLYPGNEGYSVMMKGRSGMDTETVRLPYEEAELLEYIDNEELSPVLVDILECSQVNIFYSGCVIAEVRDYRRSTCPTIYESHHVLLRPTMQTLICDVNSLSSEWTDEDKMALEAQLILATQEPLCLDPSVTVALVANRQQYERQAFAGHSIKQWARKFSQTAINRKWKFERHAAPPNLRLCDFLTVQKYSKIKNGTATSTAASLRLGKMSINSWKQREVKLTAPDEVNAMLYAMSIPPPHPSGNHLDFVEEYILESKQGNGKGYYCRLSIQLRPVDDVYVGELYTDRDYVVGVPRGGSCWFEFRTKADVDKYLHQFIEIFTQESRKAVKISHKVGDEDPIVRTLPGGQLIVFPLTSAASTALMLGELPSPVSKVAPKRPASPTVSLSDDTPAIGLQRPPSRSSTNDSSCRSASPTPASISPNSQSLPAPNPTPPLASRIISLSPAPPAATTTQLMPLAAVTHGGDIAVPISLAVVASGSNQQNIVATPAGVIVGQIPNLVAQRAVPISVSAASPQSVISSNMTTTSSIPSGSSIVVPSGMLTASMPSVLTAPTGVVSIPVGITGSLSSQNLAARLVASGFKNSTITGQSNLGGLLQVAGSHATGHKPVAAKIGISPSIHTFQAVPGTIPPIAHSATKFGSTLMKFSGQPHLHFTLQQSQVASLQLQQLRQKQQEPSVATSSMSFPTTTSSTTTVVTSTSKGKSRKRKAATTPPPPK